MELYENVFNTAGIYDMLFINTKSVLEYPTLSELKEKRPDLYERWKYLAIGTDTDKQDVNFCEQDYLNRAPYFPEFTKIVVITYATLYRDKKNGELKRYFKAIQNHDELIVLATFMDVLTQLSSDGVQSTPQKFPTICGHNITNHDIPLILKRFIKHRNELENKKVAFILKNVLNAKPWETSKIIDTVNVYKFNGKDYSTLMLISDFLGLKRTTELLTLHNVSSEYWKLYEDNPDEALKMISLQSATQTNLVIQLMNELRQF